MRECRTCKLGKDINHFTKNKRNKDGLATECRECQSVRSKKNYQNNLERRRELGRKYAFKHKEKRKQYTKVRDKKISKEKDYIDRKEKSCHKCKETLCIEYFGKRSASIDGHDNICKSCRKKRDKGYYYRNREKCIQKSAEYQKKNPWPSRLSKKKFREKADPSGWDLQKWAKAVKERDGLSCVECGEEEGLEAHHIQEKAKHPELALKLWNGITLCGRCHDKIHFPAS